MIIFLIKLITILYWMRKYRKVIGLEGEFGRVGERFVRGGLDYVAVTISFKG